MAKKARREQEEIQEVWLLSYADLMTLNTCLFLLMMVFANYEEPGSSAVAQTISESILKKEQKEDKSISEDKLKEASQEIAKHPDLLKKAKMSVNNNELMISFSSSVLFEEKSAIITEDIEPTLQALIDIIRSKDVNFRVLIEGHSDPYEHREIPNVESSWELGSIRAARVLSKFETFGFDPNKLVAISKGDSEPLESSKNDDGTPNLENMILNRRVVIKVLEPKQDLKKVKFGLGVYFNEKLNE